MATNPNQDICDMLLKLGEYERDTNGVIYKYHAYRKAAKALENLEKRVQSGAEAKKLPGIGPKIALKIDEYLGGDEPSTSTVPASKSDKNQQEYLILDHFDKIFGLTRIDAMKLKIEGITTVSQLAYAKFATEAQRVCVKYFNDLRQSIPREEVKKFHKLFSPVIESVSNHLSVLAVGQYRRKLTECDCIELLITDSALNSPRRDRLRAIVDSVLSELEKKTNAIKHRLAVRDDQCSLLVQLSPSSPKRRLSLYFASKQDHICKLLLYTGSETFFEQIRQRSLEKGYLLQPDSFRKIGLTCVAGQPISLQTEQELFEFIHSKEVNPKDRSRWLLRKIFY